MLSILIEEATTNGFFFLVPLVVFLPVLGLLINIILGGRLPERVVGWIASLAVGAAFVVSALLGYSLISHPEAVSVPFLEWIHIAELNVDWNFRVDTLSVTMMLVVSGVGTLIHIYAIGYMHEDVRFNADPGRYRRFFVYFNLFIAAMMVLVSGDNYLMLFVGWEGVGLCSYLLIGFWYEKGKDGIGNAIAGKKAFVTNRVGDFGFLIAAFLMFWAFKSLDFDTIFTQASSVAEATPGVIMAITLFMLLGVTGKSAQIPLYVWLPDAMAGPTPVSALIHAATMVTAGVYLVARSYVLFSLVPDAQNIVAIVGGVTALFAATIAIAQFDIKRVLAYSTISQLGFMVAAVGMGAFVAGMFHLVTHAFFKALLFLSSGSVIQGVEHGHHHVEHDPILRKKIKHDHHFDPQDMRNMGGLRHLQKLTFWVYLIGALALAGIFPLAGFWSKDEILVEALELQPTVFWLLIAAAFCTAFYMGRQIWMVFFGAPRSEAAAHARENPPIMTIPLVILAFLSIVGGWLNLPSTHTFSTWLEHTISDTHIVEEGAAEVEAAAAGGVNWFVILLTSALALGAIAISWYLYQRRYQEQQNLPLSRRPDDPLRAILGPVFKLLENKYYVDEFYNLVILGPYGKLSRFLAEKIDAQFWHDWFHDKVLTAGYNAITRVLSIQIDLGIIDGIANGLGNLTQRLAGAMRRLQSGYVRNYALSVFVGVVVIIGYLLFR